MNNATKIAIAVAVVVVIAGGAYWWHGAKSAQALQYRNDQYGFTFALPQDWKGYTILEQTWAGSSHCSSSSNGYCQTDSGPEIVIRNPNWTEGKPWQDIPIMVFTPDQWNEVQQWTLFVGAAPVLPTELGSNLQYVFALPAHYNFSPLEGDKEVEDILKNNPLSTHQPDATTTTDRKTYTNSTYGFTFQYPSAYKVINDQVSSDNSGKRVQMTLKSDSENTYIQVHGETAAHQCYLNYCDLPAREQKTIDGIVWDYLGNCEAGNCGIPSAIYRTSKGDMSYYLSFSNPADAEGVLQTFRF